MLFFFITFVLMELKKKDYEYISETYQQLHNSKPLITQSVVITAHSGSFMIIHYGVFSFLDSGSFRKCKTFLIG